MLVRSCFLRETGDQAGSQELELSTLAGSLQFDDRWLFAVQDAGLIQIKADDCVVITDLGVKVVEKCLGE